MWSLDILTEEISEMHYEQVSADRAACYDTGWMERVTFLQPVQT